jgi:KDO2-lipid IV(A) lauroyltransferase
MTIRNDIEHHFFQFLVNSLRHLPVTLAGDLMETTGLLVGRGLGIRRTTVLDNLARVFPHWESGRRENLADQVYRHLGLTIAETFATVPGAELPAPVAEPCWDHLDDALSLGRGVIVATGHIGNFELGGAVLAGHCRLLDVVKPQRNPHFDRELNHRRARQGIATVIGDQSGPAVVRHLRGGGVVSLLLDQDAGRAGEIVNWLGHPASTWPGAARLSLRYGCPVVPMALIRQPDRSHRLHISPPLHPTGLTEGSDGWNMYLQRIVDAVGQFVFDHPEQWFWVHRRWKSVTRRSVGEGS